MVESLLGSLMHASRDIKVSYEGDGGIYGLPLTLCASLAACLEHAVVSSLVQSLATRSTTKVEYTSQVLPKVSGL